MKVIDGKFGKKEEKDMTLHEKVALTLSAMLEGTEEGNFILIMDTGAEDMVMIASDLIAPDMVYLLESAKLNVLFNGSEALPQPTQH